MIGETLRRHRIARWESFFSKYQSTGSTDDFVYTQNSWEPAQKINNEGPPEGVRKLIDKVWQKEGNEAIPTCHGCQTSSNHIRDNDCTVEKKCTTKENDTSILDKTGNTVSLCFSADDDSGDEYDDYESYQSDSDSEDAEPLSVSKRGFFKVFCEMSLSRTRSIQQRREKSASIFDALLKGGTSPEKSIETAAVSSPSKRVCTLSLGKLSSQKHSPQDSKRSRSCEIPSTFEPSRRDDNFTSKSHSENLSVQQPRVILVELKSTNKLKLTEQRSALKESSFSEHLNRITIDSPSKPKKVETPKRAEAIFPVYDCFKDRTNDDLSLPSMSPSNENRKRKILTSPIGNCQRSPKFSPKNSRIEVSSGELLVMDSSVLRRRLSSERMSIRALKKGRSLFEI